MSVENKKIVYFDYWTVGIGNFKFFDQKLKDKGFETKLIHLASWKGLKEPKHQTIQGIDSFDITYYKTNRIYDVLRKEKPAALIMLNASFITDRTLILSCRKLGIRSIYIMHGALVREEYIDENIKIQNQSLKRNRIGKAIKHLKGTVWNYVYTIWKFDKAYFFKKHIYDVLLGSFLNPAKYLNYPPPAFDLHPDLSLVYGELDKAFYEKKNLIQGSTIKIIGNPDLDKHFKELSTLEDNKEEFFRQSNIPTNKPYITYIDEGLVEDNFWDNEYRMDFFKTIIEICNQAGYRLVIKLHPRTARGKHASSFHELKEATILSNTNFSKLVYFSEKCISHYSTTLIYPILLNKPILIPRWGRSAEQITLYTPKEVTFVNSLDELKRYIVSKDFSYDRSDYLRNYVSFTDGKTDERIVGHILNQI